MRVCIIVPMYNEEVVAKESIETIFKYIKELPSVFTVLAVDDGSKDSTRDVLKELEKVYSKDEFQIVFRSNNKGYGAASKTGIDYAINSGYDYVIHIDSDLTNHPKYLSAFYDKMCEGWDYIKATRFSKGGGMEGVPWKRRFISWCGNIFAKVVTGLPLSDITNGFRAVKVDVYKQLKLTEDHFAIIVEELMKAKKVTNSFCEIPNILGTRGENSGNSKFTYDFNTFWRYFINLFV